MINAISKYKSSIRFFAVMCAWIISIAATVYTNIMLIGIMIAKDSNYTEIFIISVAILCIGVSLSILFCIFVHHLLAYEGKVCLPKVLRIPEAMTLLHETVTNKKLRTINYYWIKIYKTNFGLGADPVENVDCKEISGFHSWLFWQGDKNRYLGSERICCDYNDIQNIINDNQEKWGNCKTDSDISSKAIDKLKLEIVRLQAEKNDFAGKYTAANARITKRQKKIDENYQHITVLIKLTNHVIAKYNIKKKITKGQIKKEYLSIGKAYGITSMPNELMHTFRKSMPTELINWSGAPVHGIISEKT